MRAVGWLEAGLSLCNRSYRYLFDKGAGRPDCWLFADIGSDASLRSEHTIVGAGACHSDATNLPQQEHVGAGVGHSGESCLPPQDRTGLGAAVDAAWTNESALPQREPGFAMTGEQLLASLGCFDDVKRTKVGDRIGLCFTQTVPVLELGLDQIVAVPERVGNGHAFSNGCGVMGTAVARHIQVGAADPRTHTHTHNTPWAGGRDQYPSPSPPPPTTPLVSIICGMFAAKVVSRARCQHTFALNKPPSAVNVY